MFNKTIILNCLCALAFSVGNATEYRVAFYSDFEPISYASSREIGSHEFNQPNGYEADLLKAIALMPNSDMTFTFQGVKKWDGLWLMPSTDSTVDIAIGGITREDRRLVNEVGEEVVAVTHKTVTFKQSLLMGSEDVERIRSHDDLTCAYTIGAVRGTTGEYRFLAQADLIDSIETGLLLEGVTVITHQKEAFRSDGTLSIFDPLIANRTQLIPPDCSLPLVKYFVAEDSMIPALEEGLIDGIARGFIGNKLVADKSDGKMKVTAVYSLECPKQQSIECKRKEEAVFYVKKENTPLLEKLNAFIDYLTDEGKIDYDHWKENPSIFFLRALNVSAH